MLYTVKLLSKTIIENIKISEHFYGRMLTISFEVRDGKDFYYSNSIKMPYLAFTKIKAKKLILVNIKEYILNKQKLLAEKEAFQEEYEITI